MQLAIRDCRVDDLGWLGDVAGLIDLQLDDVDTSGAGLDLSFLGSLEALKFVRISTTKVSDSTHATLSGRPDVNVVVR